MKLVNQGKFRKVLSIILFIFWLSLIFFFSNQNGELSSHSSSLVVNIVNSFLQLFNPSIDISIYPIATFIIRKLAHMFLYFVLYLITYYVMWQFKIEKRGSLALLFCFFYAITDEVHQLFIDSRSGQIMDVLIDTTGSLIAILLINLKKIFARIIKSN